MSANLLPKERSLKNAVLCASFDRKVRAEIKNAREDMRLEKQYRNIEMFKNSAAKTHIAEKNRVTSRMQSLRKTVLRRAQSIETVSSATIQKVDVHLPRIASALENGRKMARELDVSKSVPDIQLLCIENEQKPTHLPTITLNSSPRGTRRFKTEEHNVHNARDHTSNRSRVRTQSHGDLRRCNERNTAEDLNSNVKYSLESDNSPLESEEDENPEGISNRKELLDVSSLQGCSRFTSRRRSLSTGDITLAERIHSFLESVENCRASSDSLDYSSSNSGDEKESV